MQELDVPTKYFERGLIWFDQYPIYKILAKEKILPGQQFDAIDVHQAIKRQLNVNAIINCLKEEQNGDQYLFEVKLCFDKKLELSHCLRKPNADGVITNCNPKKKIQYPVNLPAYLIGDSANESTVWRFIIHFISIILIVVLVFFAYKSAKSRYRF